ncbi:CGH_1_collapsed_G0036220.mRNA.1.CDS.1 [Saccharomyces cerevisiae]|nr:CGH_1_collapsed_G0036220.mRNA.1.CDS.1 [Saccharomyces cerevisiae]
MIYNMAHVQLLLLYFFVSTVKAFYLPGVAPTTYRENDNIPLLVNHLTPSMNYQHKDEDGNNVSGDKENFLYSYDYYYNRFHFCQPEKVEKQPESLGSVIFGDRIYNSPFQLNMLQEKECESLCKTVIPGDDAKFINKLIKNGFFQNWLIDGLPAAREVYDGRTKTSFYGAGFNLGFVQVTQGTDIEATPKGAETTDKDVELETRNDRNMVKTYELPYFANHFDIMIEYHDRGEGNYRVVGVIVEPVSIKRSSPGTCETTGSPLMLDEENDNEVYFTYSVKFSESATSWATRWDKYLHVYDPSIQWFSLINFSLVVVLLSSVVIHSLLRALKSDFARYNELNSDDDFQEDSGWKLNHGDVFPSTLFFMVFLWFLFSIPLSFAGSLIARKRCHWDEHPTKTNQIARQIPFQPWYLKTIPATLIAGIFPFGSIAVELYFIYTSLWFNKIFYMFGFLFFSFLLLTLTSSLVTILITYHSLCLENWKWQWRGFIIGGAGCALYVFIHSILFTKFKLGGFTTIVLYVGYSSVISLLCCLVTGSIGFISSMLFVRKIYSSIKVD